jgi:hypothetical protein
MVALMAPNRDPDTSKYELWGAVTAAAPLLPGRARGWWLRAVFCFGRHSTLLVQPVLRTKVIALGRFTLWPSARRPEVLFFETNWTGSAQTYIPDLGRLMPSEFRGIWGMTRGVTRGRFRGPKPTTYLLEFVEDIDYGTDHLWSDYSPEATTQAVSAALALQTKIKRFLHATRTAGPERFESHFIELLIDTQRLW